MLCAISGEAPEEPVVSKKTGSIVPVLKGQLHFQQTDFGLRGPRPGTVYEKRLIEKYIEEHGKEPGTEDELDIEDLLPVKTARIVRPRPPTLTSIPALLAAFQNEWDALALETYNLQEQLARTREELATALYQHDAAVRVIARLTKERDEARDSLSKVTVSGGTAANGDAMAIDNEGLPEDLANKVDETHQSLSKSRKKRPVPEGWVSADEIAAFDKVASEDSPVQQASSIGLEGDYAAISGLQGDVAIFSVEAAKVERSLKVNEPITDTLWTGSRVIFATSKGSVKIYENGSEIASFSEHAGPATGLALHPCGDLLASVGSDKSFVLYDLSTLKRVSRVYTDSSLTTCKFHPDGHFLAVGTVSGEIRGFLTKTGEQATSFDLGAPIQALTFSENGYWIAATAKGQSTVTILDLRKEGAAATAKVLDTGSSVVALDWDYTGQYLATVGPAGITVQQYAKSSKKWTQPVASATPGVSVRWGAEAKKLVSVSSEGVVSILGVKE